MGEGLVVTDWESTVGSLSQVSQDFPFSAVVIIGPEDIFFMDSLGFFGDTAFGEEGSSEEVGDSFGGFEKCFVGNFEVVIGFNIGCVCIVHAWVLVYERWVFVVDWEFLWTHKQHMFEEMGQTQWTIGIL